MEYQINHVPFEMKDIPDKLFNSPFLSDVSFLFGEKQIYAHSLELMKRSIVFQEQLEPSLGEKKLIPITNYGYDVFYQFIRFIYTDQCYIDKLNWYELLKLAKSFKVIRLVNMVQNSKYPSILKLYDFSIVENHQITLNHAKKALAFNLNWYINEDEFKSIHKDTLEEILKFDPINPNVSELDILAALVRWMMHDCVQNQIEFSECRQKLYSLIRLIRFPTMTIEQLQQIRTEFPDLLTKSDHQNIGGQKIYGPTDEDELWNCIPRMKLSVTEFLFEIKKISNGTFLTTFSVSSEMILGAFILGPMFDLKYLHIIISCNNPGINGDTQIPININRNACYVSTLLISLGSSILIRPGATYTISCKYISENNNEEKFYYCRKPQTEIIINAPPNTVKMLEAHEVMHEIFFYKPGECS